MVQRFTLVCTSHLYLERNDQILLLRRFNTGYEDGKYSMVAGHFDGNETSRECMVRETFEEAGIIVQPTDLEIVHVMHRKALDERVDFFLKAKRWSGEPKIIEPNKCDDLSWFDLNDLPQNLVPYVDHAIKCIQKRTYYSEFGWK